jgi:hypothetical protein
LRRFVPEATGTRIEGTVGPRMHMIAASIVLLAVFFFVVAGMARKNGGDFLLLIPVALGTVGWDFYSTRRDDIFLIDFLQSTLET